MPGGSQVASFSQNVYENHVAQPPTAEGAAAKPPRLPRNRTPEGGCATGAGWFSYAFSGMVASRRLRRLLHSAYDAPASGNVKRNVVPSPSFDSTQILPPWRSTIFLQIARPMPVPGYSSRA